MRVSIVVRTLNEPEELRLTLEQLAVQRTEAQYEIVFVDSGSAVETLNVIETFLATHAGVLLNIMPAEFTYGRALNTGIEAATGEIAVALSSHCCPLSEDWLRTLVQHFTDPRVGAVYGKQIVDPRINPFDVRSRQTYFGPRRAIFDRSNKMGLRYSNANGAFRKSHWIDRHFDEDLPFCEDLAWACQLLNDGFSVVYEPDAAVKHSHPPGVRSAYRISRSAARARTLVSKDLDLTQFVSESGFSLADIVNDLRTTIPAGRHSLLLVYPFYKMAELAGYWRGNA